MERDHGRQGEFARRRTGCAGLRRYAQLETAHSGRREANAADGINARLPYALLHKTRALASGLSQSR